MPPKHFFHRGLSGVLSLAVMVSSVGAGPAAPVAPNQLLITLPLGQAMTVPVLINHAGYPAGEAALFEAWPDTPARLSTAPLRVSTPQVPHKLAPALRASLQANGRAPMLIYLNDQADLRAASQITSWAERGWAVYTTLHDHAARTQTSLLADLRAQGYQPRPFWIVNAVWVEGDLPLAETLARDARIAALTPDARTAVGPVPAHPKEPAATAHAASEVTWGLEKIRAPQVWQDFGVRGAGVVVANIDTGVAYTHPVLLENYRGWSEAGLTHAYNWFDPAFRTAAPDDRNGHGTHTLGTMAASAQVGVAPAAQWIAARGCANTWCNESDLLASAQWLLAPTDPAGLNPRPDLRPHIINNSWGGGNDDRWYAGYVQAWNAAGIFSAFANGNVGLFGCGSSISPGDYPEAFAVGATDSADALASFSSRGPTSDGRIKPDLAAPGVNVVSAWPDGSLVSLNGTSMATPHVAGAVALLWSANPLLIGDLAATQAVLTGHAVPRPFAQCGGETGTPNNGFGWGRLDVYAAMQAAQVDVPWLSVPPTLTLAAGAFASLPVTVDARQVTEPGSYTARVLVKRGDTLVSVPVTLNVMAGTGTVPLTGQLLDRWDGFALTGHVALADGPTLRTDARGHFTATVPTGDYTLTARATGYLPFTTSVTASHPVSLPLSLTLNAPRAAWWLAAPLSATLDFAQTYTAPITVSNLGPVTLTASATTPNWEWEPRRLTGTVLYDVSALPALPLADDMIYTHPLTLGFRLPLFGTLTDTLFLSSNGWVSVMPPARLQTAPAASCIPERTGLPYGVLAGFWTDLDPSQGGTVRAGALTTDTFVVSFEAVPPWQWTPVPNPPTYTFQMAFHAAGEVELLYGHMGTPAWNWAVGAQTITGRGQNLACHAAPTALAGTGWALTNQPESARWLALEPANLSLPPYSSATLSATLRGLGYVPWRVHPLVGALELRSDDPRQPLLTLPVTMRPAPPPFSLWVPLARR